MSIQKFLKFSIILCCSCISNAPSKKETLNTGLNPNLIITFESKDELDIDNLVVKLAKKIPEKKYTEILISGNPIPLFYKKKVQQRLNIYKPDLQKKFENITTSDTISLELAEGEYYFVIENLQNNFFYLPTELYESKIFQIFFGFTREDGKFYQSEYWDYKIVNYQGEVCSHSYHDDISMNNGNYVYCPKILIKKNNSVKIKLKFSEKEEADLSTRIAKYIFPGIIFLGPINTGGAYYKRYLKVEIENSEQNSESK